MENFQKLPFGIPVQACATPTPHTSTTQGDNTGPTRCEWEYMVAIRP